MREAEHHLPYNVARDGVQARNFWSQPTSDERDAQVHRLRRQAGYRSVGQSVRTRHYAANLKLAQCGFSDITFGSSEGDLPW